MTFFSAPASSAGPVRISIRRAGATAARFLLDRSPGIARRGLVLVGRQAVSHERGEALEGFAFRSRMSGVPGPAVADVEVDLRSGRVVFAAAGTVATRGARFRVGLAAARRIAAAAVGGGRVLSARRDIWRYPRWTVILRPRAKPGETAAVELDALDGRVMSISNADPS
jgi:hypothetical protein